MFISSTTNLYVAIPFSQDVKFHESNVTLIVLCALWILLELAHAKHMVEQQGIKVYNICVLHSMSVPGWPGGLHSMG